MFLRLMHLLHHFLSNSPYLWGMMVIPWGLGWFKHSKFQNWKIQYQPPLQALIGLSIKLTPSWRGVEKFIDEFFEEKFKYGLLNNQFLGEINRIGNTLNQQTRKINSAKFFTDDDRNKLFSELVSIKNEMEKLTNLIQKEKDKQ